MAIKPLMFQGINAISKRHAALPRQPAARIPLVLPEADRFEVAFTSSALCSPKRAAFAL
jgi:hypothetical protein